MSFVLHPRLEADCLTVGDLPVCRLLLMNNKQFHWLILVPRKDGLRELFDLSPEEYTQTMDEVRFVCEKFSAHTQAHKMNIAALGNMVPQLHIHLIARYPHDAAWPNPVWNSGIPASPYPATEREAKLVQLRTVFNITKM